MCLGSAEELWLQPAAERLPNSKYKQSQSRTCWNASGRQRSCILWSPLFAAHVWNCVDLSWLLNKANIAQGTIIVYGHDVDALISLLDILVENLAMFTEDVFVSWKLQGLSFSHRT